MKNIPFLDLQRQYNPLKESLLHGISELFDNCDFVGGSDVRDFEKELASYLGVDDVVSCANATTGLFASLSMLGIGSGNEVITTAMTAFPTAEAIAMTGADLVLCDISNGTYTLDPQKVAESITPKTRAIIVVHLYGHPADMTSLKEIADSHELVLIEDCAQALGASYKNNLVGTIGDAAVYSFFPSKPLGGCGDGGAVITRKADDTERIRMFCNHGRKSKFSHEFIGLNSRLDTFKAILLRKTLPLLDSWNAARNTWADYYNRSLIDIPDIKLSVIPEERQSVWHIYAIEVSERDRFRTYLKERGIQTGVHYPFSLNELPALNYLGRGPGSYPVAEHLAATTVSLPMYPTLTSEEIDRVCNVIRDFFS